MINFIIIAVVFSFLIYLVFSLIFYLGLKNRKIPQSFSRPFVSVIIAARNEEKNIANILTYLKNQTYPHDFYEVIVADDDSKDKTAEIVSFFSEKWENLKYLKITNRKDVISPKKNALSKAIDKSRGEVLLLTDADCFVGKNWINSTVSNFTDDVDMVCGFSRTKIDNWQKSPLYQKFEFFDFAVMYAAAAGAISSGNYFSCSGQNIAYRKDSFMEVGGFSKVSHIQSGDDVNLLQLFRKNDKKVIFSSKYDSFVYTKPISSFSALINQRTRWASNYKYQTSLNPLFFLYLTATFIVISFMFILPFLSLFIGLGLILMKLISDLLFIRFSFDVFRIEKQRLYFFPIWFFLQPFYIVIVFLLGIFEIFRWKK